MENKFYTFIVVPHAKAQFRKFQVPVRLLRWGGAGLGTLALGLTGIVGHYFWIAAERHDAARLRVENQALTEKARQYEDSLTRLQAKMAVLQKMVDKLGVMAGIDSSPQESAVGVGGVTGAESIAPSREADFSLPALEKNVEALNRRSAELEAVYQDQKQLLASTPSIWPVRGYLSSRFGNRVDPFTGAPDFHPGIDISTPRGTRIHAPAAGLVVSVGERGGYGKSIVIDHGFGVLTRYAHMDGYNVRPGQKVKRGDVLGFVGNTGRSVAPHLHYEVWVNDKLQNPIHYILDEYRSFG
jgi:murein DD-endopeptidase MepM/ murein hydrolase activator NlpD